MELALLCEVKVLMCIVDKNEKTSLYSSESNLPAFSSHYLFESHINKEIFCTKDVIYLLIQYKNLFVENLKTFESSNYKFTNNNVSFKESLSDCENAQEKVQKGNEFKKSALNKKRFNNYNDSINRRTLEYNDLRYLNNISTLKAKIDPKKLSEHEVYRNKNFEYLRNNLMNRNNLNNENNKNFIKYLIIKLDKNYEASN